MSERSGPAAAVEPTQTRLVGSFGCALTIDVEEWYHTCLVREYVDPARRPAVAEELDRLLPEVLELLAGLGVRATFFVLGEVAARLPGRIREIAAAGHEVGSHAFLHYRAEWLRPAAWRADVARCKSLLEDLLGDAVLGFRAPEWSLRSVSNPRLAVLSDLGFRYDSSLTPCWGSGRRSNPRWVTRLSWGPGASLLELPPLAYARELQLPIGGWTGRLLPASVVARVAGEHRRRGGMPILVVHPWELSGRPTPGLLTGLARFLHEAGRFSFRERFSTWARALELRGIAEAAGVVGAAEGLGVTGLPPTLEMRRPERRSEAGADQLL